MQQPVVESAVNTAIAMLIELTFMVYLAFFFVSSRKLFRVDEA
jgi:hypothetical protein